MKRALRVGFKALLVVFFVGSGVMHFLVPLGVFESGLGPIQIGKDAYLNIMPDYIPAHTFMIFLSGITEIAAGIMLAIPRWSKYGAWFIIAHLMVFFTVHFWMIQHAEDRYSDIPLVALWMRIVFQVIFIVWAYWFASDPKSAATPAPADAA